MSFARTTIGLSQLVEGMVSGRPGRRGVLVALITLSGLLILSGGLMFVMMRQVGVPHLAVIGLVVTLLVFSLMLVRHEWLLILAIIQGHTIFYGSAPTFLGMRVRESVGPSDLLIALAFVAGLIYWYGRDERPRLPLTLLWPPLILFSYSAVYILIAFFLWGRQDNSLLQAVGWMYFMLIPPVYICLATGRVWKPFFLTIFFSLLAGGFLSACLEVGVFQQIIGRMGYGSLGWRTYGDLSVKTNFLGMCIVGTLIAGVVMAFAKRPFWRYLALSAMLAGLFVLFVDRGRIHYAGMAAASALVFAFLPLPQKGAALLRTFTALLVTILVIQAIGGPAKAKFDGAVEKAYERLKLTTSQAITADSGLTKRMFQARQAEAVFLKNPLVGGGPGTRFGTEFRWEDRVWAWVTWLDNSWIYPLAVGGIVGLLMILSCYLFACAFCIWAYSRLKNPLHRSLALVPPAMYIFLLICSPVTWWMVDRFHVAAFAIATGLIAALVYHEKIHGSEEPVISF